MRTATNRASTRRPALRAGLAVAVAVVSLAVAMAAGLQAQVEITVPDGERCPRCDIELRQVAVLGTADGPGALDDVPSSVRRDGQGRYFVTQYVVFHEILVFDERGAHVRSLGRQGSGPGEFRNVALVDIVGDSLYVFDNGNVRLSVFAPDLSLARTDPLPAAMTYGAVVLAGGVVVLNAAVPTASGIGLPLHRLRPGAEPLSFGSLDGGTALGPSPVPTMRTLAPARDGGVWATPRTRYELARWTPAGELSARLVRQARWFAPYMERRPLPDPPEPFLVAVREIAPNRVMTLITMPKADFTRRLGPPIGTSARGNPLYDVTRRQDLFDTVVEVIDAADGRLLVSRRFEASLVGFADDRHVYGYRLDDDDIPRIDILRVHWRED